MVRGAAGGATTTTRPPPRLVSVIIPALNAAGTIDQQLLALAYQRYCGDWEVIVADNGSSDATTAIARQWSPSFPRLLIVDASQRAGPSYARNAAMDAAGGDLFLFVDADDVVEANWLQTMCDAARKFDHFGGTYTDFTEGSPGLIPHGSPLRPFRFMRAAWGGNLGVWRDVADAVGGFNEYLVGGGDDVEFSWRVQRLGFSFGWVPAAVVFHRRRSTLRGLARQRYFYGKADGEMCVEFANDGLRFTYKLKSTWKSIRGLDRDPLSTPQGRRAFVRSAGWLAGWFRGWLRASWQRGATGGRPMSRR